MKTIIFEDNKQDFLEWDIDENNTVVACRPFQGRMWCGCMVDSSSVHPGAHIRYIHPRVGAGQIKHKIKEVIETNI